MPVRDALSWAVPTVLLGGAACVSCTLTVVAAVAATVGITTAPLLLGLPLAVALPVAAASVGGSVLAYRAMKNEEVACAVKPARHPYLRFSRRNALLGLALAFLAVAGVALAAKLAIETFTTQIYMIHWDTTVPALVAAFAWIAHGELNRRDDARASTAPPQA
ncbi:MAG TPA: hypothetical protein VM889_03475 [Candidatus Thermoplasmatota archaeon]|nr:hypothetical protein [Candidatus Thermoplasmatota archaeon]